MQKSESRKFLNEQRTFGAKSHKFERDFTKFRISEKPYFFKFDFETKEISFILVEKHRDSRVSWNFVCITSQDDNIRNLERNSKGALIGLKPFS